MASTEEFVLYSGEKKKEKKQKQNSLEVIIHQRNLARNSSDPLYSKSPRV